MQVWFHGQAYDSTFWDNGLVSDVQHWFGHCHVRQPYNVLWDKTSWRKISFFDSKWNPFFLVQLVQINQRPFNFQSKTLCIHLNSEYSSSFSIFDRVDWYFIHWFWAWKWLIPNRDSDGPSWREVWFPDLDLILISLIFNYKSWSSNQENLILKSWFPDLQI